MASVPDARTVEEFAALKLELMLYDVQSPTNIGMAMRIAEVYGFALSLYDPRHVLDDAEKFKTIEDFACGSLPRRGFRLLSDDAAVSRWRAGRRLVATSILPGARPLESLAFEPGDIVVLGNEYDGVPDALVAEADVKLHIPMPRQSVPKPASWYPIDPTRSSVARDGSPSLNVAMSAAIITHAAYVQWLARSPAPHGAPAHDAAAARQ